MTLNKGPLLILDLDEAMIHASETPVETRLEPVLLATYWVYERPGLQDFLSWARAHFTLAVWTSSTASYANAICQHFIEPHCHLQFIFARDRCTPKIDSQRYETIWSKNLTKVKKLGWPLEQVLIVDDSPEKLRRHFGNLIHLRPFLGDPKDRELELLRRYLTSIKALANYRPIEKRNWQERALNLPDTP